MIYNILLLINPLNNTTHTKKKQTKNEKYHKKNNKKKINHNKTPYYNTKTQIQYLFNLST
jgi:hypothetical protein